MSTLSFCFLVGIAALWTYLYQKILPNQIDQTFLKPPLAKTMANLIVPIEKKADEIFNFCTKYLVRDRSDLTISDKFSEGWRFPVVSPKIHPEKHSGLFNEVTFIYHNVEEKGISKVEITGSFMLMHERIALQPVPHPDGETYLYSLTILLPIGSGYRYRFIVDGEQILDPINPQRITLETGRVWSFFFTDYYNFSHLFEEWETNLLKRLIQQITPFRGEAAENFITRYYDSLSKAEKEAMPIYRLDDSVGELNYITNILAREEHHRLIDYKICLKLIDSCLRKRNPVVNSWKVSSDMMNDFYNEMASGQVPGWDYDKYGEPSFFLKLLRRHCIVGAFCHPRYGGNIGAAGWNFLKERYSKKGKDGLVVETFFNWELAIEKPLGTNMEYFG